MDSDLKCNNLQCRKALMDKAVVVSTISVIFARVMNPETRVIDNMYVHSYEIYLKLTA